MKIALVYDRVTKLGGAERVLTALHQLWPTAPLFTSVYNPRSAPWARDFTVYTSFLQKIPFVRSHHEWFAWLMPLAFESFDFDGYDVVVTVTSAEAKGIITKPETLHLCYLLTPTRYLWSHTHFYQTGHYATNKNFLTRRLTPLFFSSLRRWDQVAATRPDQIVAISSTVARRCWKYYRRTVAAVINPPVNLDLARADTTADLPDNYYLLVSRLVPYKRVDLAIQACSQLGVTLVIVGDGPYKQELKKIAGDNVKFVGRVSQGKLVRYYQKAQALIFPAEEDFGIVCLEAQAAGIPVVAYARGGAAETIIPGKTGVLFKQQTKEALIRSLNTLQSLAFTKEAAIKNADKYAVEIFKSKFKHFVEDSWQQYQK